MTETKRNELFWSSAVAVIFALATIYFVTGCSKSVDDLKAPACAEPVADTGGDVYFYPLPESPTEQAIGTKQPRTVSCHWAPEDGIADPNACQTLVDAPEKTTHYTLTVTNKCGSSEDYMRAVMPKEKKRGDDEIPTVTIDGKEYPTGYFPGHKQYYRAQYRDFSGKDAIDPTPEELDYKPFVQRIFRQQCGDCWAQGGVTAFETLIGLSDRTSRFIARQASIDCSGYGSCGGGQISIGYFENPKGAIYESEYPYRGTTQRCKMPNGPYHESTKSTFFVKNLDWPNLKRALMETGPLEVCGASSALGNGGWVSRNPGGGTDHCYALVGWYQGSKHGQPAGEYGIIANSWGTSWGDGGYGYYLLAKDGTKLNGNVITEAAGMEYKAPCPAPKADAGPDRTILQIPGKSWSTRIGTPQADATAKSLWTPSEDIDPKTGKNVVIIKTPTAAQPIAKPVKTTQFTVTVENACGKVSSSMTVHVFRDTERGIEEVL